MTGFGLVPKLPEITDYVARTSARPAARKLAAEASPVT
jgi:hypothetical protein